MARPKSDDKRNAILAAAIEVIAEQGVSAPTAKIASLAGVAEGTLFTYFSNKDELLNQLYVGIKSELRDVMMSAYPKSKGVKTRVRHAWQMYVGWGIAWPLKRKVLGQLAVSDRITDQSKATGLAAFAEFTSMVEQNIDNGVLRNHPAEFVSAIMGTLAETTMDFMTRFPQEADRYSESGFEAFWNAIAKK